MNHIHGGTNQGQDEEAHSRKGPGDGRAAAGRSRGAVVVEGEMLGRHGGGSCAGGEGGVLAEQRPSAREGSEASAPVTQAKAAAVASREPVRAPGEGQ